MTTIDRTPGRTTAEGLAIRDLSIKSGGAGRLFVRDGGHSVYAAIAPTDAGWLIAAAGDPQTAVLLRGARRADDEATAVAEAIRLLGGHPVELAAP